MSASVAFLQPGSAPAHLLVAERSEVVELIGNASGASGPQHCRSAAACLRTYYFSLAVLDLLPFAARSLFQDTLD
eukprot:2151947-Rhodomonas_salina.2